MGFVCVPLYDTLGENAIEYIIDHSESSFIIVAAAKLPAFSKALPLIKTTLKGVVYWGKSPSPEALSAIQAKGTNLAFCWWPTHAILVLCSSIQSSFV